MGVESANYLYTAANDVVIAEILLALGAEQPAGWRSVEYVMRGNDHWIDVQIQNQSPGSPPSAWIRVALTNPLPVESKLRELAEALLQEGGGSLVDMDSRKRLSGLAGTTLHENEWEELWSAYLNKRATFRHHYGTFEAAISGSVVFATLRRSAD